MNRPSVSRVWKFQDPIGFEYPENDEAYDDFFEGKEDLGVCFSGGGTRAATCTLGQLRGLHNIGVLDRAKYIASNSGGTWGSLPYIYFKGDLDIYFGEYYPPENLTVENVKNIPSGSFLHNTTKANAAVQTLFNRLGKKDGDESFSQGIARIFLKPHNIGYNSKYFTLNEKSFESLKNDNPQIESDDFEKVTDGRPFHIANGTLHNRRLSWKGNKRLYHVEMTPLYAGIKVFHEDRGDKKTDVGGGFVAPFAFDSIFRKKQDGEANPPLVEIKTPGVDKSSHENEFTLADIMGISGSALTSVDISVNRPGNKKTGLLKKVVQLYLKSKDVVSGVATYAKPIAYILNSLPEIHHFSPHNIEQGDLKTVEYNVGDGGPVDDIALMPLLARDVAKILCFCNVQSKILKEKKDKSLEFDVDKFDKDILSLFGLKRKGLPFAKKVKPIKGGGFQKVFESKDFWELAKSLEQASRDNKPLIHEGVHSVLPNKHFGIKGGYKAKIMWFYNERCKSWEEKIDSKIFKELGDEIGEKGFGKRLKNFPNFKTFGENGFRVIDMHPEQVTLLSNFQTWIIKENEDRIVNFSTST